MIAQSSLLYTVGKVHSNFFMGFQLFSHRFPIGIIVGPIYISDRIHFMTIFVINYLNLHDASKHHFAFPFQLE